MDQIAMQTACEPYLARMKNQQQKDAFNALAGLLNGIQLASPYYRLIGYAGTGKTFLVSQFCGMAAQLGLHNRVFVTATTNMAAQQLRNKINVVTEAVLVSTIYSLLGLRISDDTEQPQLVSPEEKEKSDALRGALVFVDEASMVTGELLGHIHRFATRYGCTIILIGDDCQLPPVEGDEDPECADPRSPVWDLDCPTSVLTEIVRYDGPIEQLSMQLRELIKSDDPTENDVRIVRDVAEDKSGVYQVGLINFESWIMDAARKQLFLESYKATALAFTNKQVERYNELIRRGMFGLDAQQPFLIGERVVFTKPFMRGEGKDRSCVARNRDQYYIIAIREETFEQDVITTGQLDYDNQPLVAKLPDCEIVEVRNLMGARDALVRVTYKIFYLTLTDSEHEFVVPVLHPESKPVRDKVLGSMADHAKSFPKGNWQQKKAWKNYWEHHGSTAWVDYAYASTTHCSQGSTYEIVFVDVTNIMQTRKAKLKTRLKSLYVAATRPSRVLVVN